MRAEAWRQAQLLRAVVSAWEDHTCYKLQRQRLKRKAIRHRSLPEPCLPAPFLPLPHLGTGPPPTTAQLYLPWSFPHPTPDHRCLLSPTTSLTQPLLKPLTLLPLAVPCLLTLHSRNLACCCLLSDSPPPSCTLAACSCFQAMRVQHGVCKPQAFLFLQVLCHSQTWLVSMARLPGTPAQQEAAAAAAGGCAYTLGVQAGVGRLEALLLALGQAQTCS